MKKRTINLISYKTLWFIIFTLPILLYIIDIVIVCASSETPISFHSLPDFSYFLTNNFGTTTSNNNIILKVLVDLFGANGMFPMFEKGYTSILNYFAYFINMSFVRIVVDIILWLPRLIQKALNIGGDERD